MQQLPILHRKLLKIYIKYLVYFYDNNENVTKTLISNPCTENGIGLTIEEGNKIISAGGTYENFDIYLNENGARVSYPIIGIGSDGFYKNEKYSDDVIKQILDKVEDAEKESLAENMLQCANEKILDLIKKMRSELNK